MTQQIPQKRLEIWCAHNLANLAEHDLLSLRAAVRRLLGAEDAARNARGMTSEAFLTLLHERDAAEKALRVEMASIDGAAL